MGHPAVGEARDLGSPSLWPGGSGTLTSLGRGQQSACVLRALWAESQASSGCSAVTAVMLADYGARASNPVRDQVGWASSMRGGLRLGPGLVGPGGPGSPDSRGPAPGHRAWPPLAAHPPGQLRAGHTLTSTKRLAKLLGQCPPRTCRQWHRVPCRTSKVSLTPSRATWGRWLGTLVSPSENRLLPSPGLHHFRVYKFYMSMSWINTSCPCFS